MQEKTLKIRSATSEIQRKSEVPLPKFSEKWKRFYLVNLFISMFSSSVFYIAQITPTPPHHYSPYSGSCRCPANHPQRQGRSPAYCHRCQACAFQSP